MAQQDEHFHEDENEVEGAVGMAIGFRILEHDGGFYLAEAEIAPYVDEVDELGVTIVFHPLDGINPVESEEDVEWPAWPIDIDDELTRDPNDPLPVQFASIVRQLHALDTVHLRQYLEQAREVAAEEEGANL